MAFDSKNNIYVGWIMGGALGKYDRETKKVSVFIVPTHNAIPYGVIADRNDNIWMALWDSGNIAKFDTTTNEWTIFTPPTYPGHVRRLNVDAQNNIWFGMWSAGKRPGKLGKLDQTTGRITEYKVPRQNSNPYDVAQDLEGNIWAPTSVEAPHRCGSSIRETPRSRCFRSLRRLRIRQRFKSRGTGRSGIRRAAASTRLRSGCCIPTWTRSRHSARIT